METKYLNVEMDPELIRRANMKAEALNLSLKAFISRLVEINTKDIAKVKVEPIE